MGLLDILFDDQTQQQQGGPGMAQPLQGLLASPQNDGSAEALKQRLAQQISMIGRV